MRPGGPAADRQAGRDLDQRLGNQHRDRVQVRAVGAQAQTLRFQRDRAAAAKRIDHRRRLLGEKGIDFGLPRGRCLAQPAGDRTRDLVSCSGEDVSVVRVFPLHQPLDDPEEAAAFPLLYRLCRKLFGHGRGIVNELRKQHRPTRRQRSPGPPQMQGRGMPVPDRLLPRRRRIDRVQRQRDFDEFPARRGHDPITERRELPHFECLRGWLEPWNRNV